MGASIRWGTPAINTSLLLVDCKGRSLPTSDKLTYIRSFSSTPATDRKAKISERMVRMKGNIALFAIVRSPMFACVNRISRKEEIIVAFEDFIDRPINSAIKLIVTIEIDFTISCT